MCRLPTGCLGWFGSGGPKLHEHAVEHPPIDTVDTTKKKNVDIYIYILFVFKKPGSPGALGI